MTMLNDPSQSYVNSARRDQSLQYRAYRQAKKKKDYMGAFNITSKADQQGLPVGRPVRSEEIQDVGTHWYDDARKRKWIADKYEVDGYRRNGAGYGAATQQGYTPNSQQNQGMVESKPQGQDPQVARTGYPGGVGSDPLDSLYGGTIPQTARGGAPALQQQQTPAAPYSGSRIIGANGLGNSGSIGGYSFSQEKQSPLQEGRSAYPSAQNLGEDQQRAAWSRAWQSARTPEEKADVVARAKAKGIKTNDELQSGATGAAGNPGAGGAPSQPSPPSGRYVDSPAFKRFETITAPMLDKEFSKEGNSAWEQQMYKLKEGIASDRRMINGFISRGVDDNKRVSDYYAAHPGYDNPDAYAAARKGEVAQSQAGLDAAIGKHQSDMRRDIESDSRTEGKIGALGNAGNYSKYVLGESERRFGKKAAVAPDSEGDRKARAEEMRRRYPDIKTGTRTRIYSR
jgi:hypothetical protein